MALFEAIVKDFSTSALSRLIFSDKATGSSSPASKACFSNSCLRSDVLLPTRRNKVTELPSRTRLCLG